jgi:hypothetical protein
MKPPNLREAALVLQKQVKIIFKLNGTFSLLSRVERVSPKKMLAVIFSTDNAI